MLRSAGLEYRHSMINHPPQRKKTMKLTLILGAVLLGTVACASGNGSSATNSAVAQLQNTMGNSVSGTVNFLQSGGKVQVSGEIRGLKPNAEHGFHVHEKGDCSSSDGSSAGGHFNPDGRAHGNPGAAVHHAGDLAGLKSDSAGVARFSFESATITVGSGSGNVVGRSLIVHSDPDDYTTQPTGNSGGRMACAVIFKT